MTTFEAQVKNWTAKARRNMDLVKKDSAQEVFFEMSRRQPGVDETGGTYEEGKVPVDTAELINSQEASINGSVKVSPLPPPPKGTKQTVREVDYALVVAQSDGDDTIEAAFTAPHARVMEHGNSKIGGRHFVRNAAQKWPEIVSRVARRYKGR